MIRLRLVSILGLSGLLAGGCADRHGTHLIGRLTYEGGDAEIAKDVPPEADPQVAKCVGDSTAADEEDRGIKTSAKITPPYFVGLWPAAREGRPESHGRLDRVSVGKPLPGDHPFIKVVVCTLDADIEKSYDWSFEEQLDGEYYIGAWFDRDMNGYPGADEPVGYYHEAATGPATIVRFRTDKAERYDVAIGAVAAPFAAQAEALRSDLEAALQAPDPNLFAAQFQPLLFKDPFNRTINQVDELYEELTMDNITTDTTVAWANDTPPKLVGAGATGTLVVTHNRLAVRDYLTRDMNREVSVALGASRDGLYQFMDWQPLVERSGDLTYSAKAEKTFNADSSLKYTVNFPTSSSFWFGVEQFVPATDATSGGSWQYLKDKSDAEVRQTGWPAPVAAGDVQFEISSAAISSGSVGYVDVAFDPATMIRVTIVPVNGTTTYDQWASPATPTEPTRGQYLRFYHYGSSYIYRKALPKK